MTRKLLSVDAQTQVERKKKQLATEHTEEHRTDGKPKNERELKPLLL
jgi:hypothetical protein